MDVVKRIEVLKGASSALYGSDAIAGVINIITDDPKSALNVSSNTRVSSHGRISESVNADANDGKLSAHLNYNYRTSDGWQLNPYEESKGELVETTKKPVYKNHSHNVSQTLSYAATERLSLHLNGNLLSARTTVPEPTITTTGISPIQWVEQPNICWLSGLHI